jgi:hypothetical protein
MKVKELRAQLETLDGEQELIVAYWDKETVEGYGSPDLSNDDWEVVVERYENGEWHWQSSAAEDFVEIAESVSREG